MNNWELWIEGWADRLERDEVQIDTWDEELIIWDRKHEEMWGYPITDEGTLI